MSGPANSLQCQMTAIFGGPGVPTGAACTFGLLASEAEGHREELRSAVALLHQAIGNTNVSLDLVRFKYGPSSTGPTYELPGGGGGGSTEALAPPNVSYLIRKSVVGVSGRFSGRFYWPGVGEAYVGGDGLLTGAWLETMGTALAAFYDDVETALGVGTQVVLDGVSSDPHKVVSYDAQVKVATQRRRLRR